MSGATTAAYITAAAAVAGAGATYMQGQAQAKEAKKANAQAEKNAADTLAAADQANNKANAKSPNTQNLLDENVQAALGGSGATMLTGSSGIDPASLLLGRNTLLGQ